MGQFLGVAFDDLAWPTLWAAVSSVPTTLRATHMSLVGVSPWVMALQTVLSTLMELQATSTLAIWILMPTSTLPVTSQRTEAVLMSSAFSVPRGAQNPTCRRHDTERKRPVVVISLRSPGRPLTNILHCVAAYHSTANSNSRSLANRRCRVFTPEDRADSVYATAERNHSNTAASGITMPSARRMPSVASSSRTWLAAWVVIQPTRPTGSMIQQRGTPIAK